MTYTFIASHAGHPLLLQRNPGRPAGRDGSVRRGHRAARQVFPQLAPPAWHAIERDGARHIGAKRISGWPHAAYDHAKTCYDREYLFQFSEMDPNIHTQALAQVTAQGQLHGGSSRDAASRSPPSLIIPLTS